MLGTITVLTAAFIAGCSSGGAGTAASTMYTDGTYTGVGLGKEGPINVTLSIANDVVTVDEITHSGETEGIGGKEAIEDGTFKAQIEEAQSAEIDGVVGATITSDGVRGAVEDALEQALASNADKAA
ncbi:MAG: FMN-binding protein [Eggerthellaceae bacterium]|nr:FMN-binding protein [Eggerthellaceae bacterium]